MAKPLIGEDRAAAFLCAHHGGVITDLFRIEGGYWSSAFGYTCDGDPLVVRFGHNREWYEIDRAAFAYAPGLPVPRVRTIGRAFDDVDFAISERVDGVYWEDQPASTNLTTRVADLLAALRAVPEADVDYTWRDWLLAGIDHEGRNAENFAHLAKDPLAGPVAERAEGEVRSMLDALPERRDLIHGDLLHKNVLVRPDLSEVTALFSWKCSARGDALFEAAALSVFGPWFPGIGAIDVWALVNDRSPEAATRFRCYELHVGLTHLGWYVQTNDTENLHRLTRRMEEIL